MGRQPPIAGNIRHMPRLVMGTPHPAPPGATRSSRPANATCLERRSNGVMSAC